MMRVPGGYATAVRRKDDSITVFYLEEEPGINRAAAEIHPIRANAGGLLVCTVIVILGVSGLLGIRRKRKMSREPDPWLEYVVRTPNPSPRAFVRWAISQKGLDKPCLEATFCSSFGGADSLLLAEENYVTMVEVREARENWVKFDAELIDSADQVVLAFKGLQVKKIKDHEFRASLEAVSLPTIAAGPRAAPPPPAPRAG